MRDMSKVSRKDWDRINKLLQEGHRPDKVHEKVCSDLGLYGVKYFGHGPTHKKRKVNHLWNAVMFSIWDDTTLHFTKGEREGAANFMKIGKP